MLQKMHAELRKFLPEIVFHPLVVPVEGEVARKQVMNLTRDSLIRNLDMISNRKRTMTRDVTMN